LCAIKGWLVAKIGRSDCCRSRSGDLTADDGAPALLLFSLSRALPRSGTASRNRNARGAPALPATFLISIYWEHRNVWHTMCT